MRARPLRRPRCRNRLLNRVIYFSCSHTDESQGAAWTARIAADRFDRATALALARAPRFADAAVVSVASMLARAATSSAAGGGGGAAAELGAALAALAEEQAAAEEEGLYAV